MFVESSRTKRTRRNVQKNISNEIYCGIYKRKRIGREFLSKNARKTQTNPKSQMRENLKAVCVWCYSCCCWCAAPCVLCLFSFLFHYFLLFSLLVEDHLRWVIDNALHTNNMYRTCAFFSFFFINFDASLRSVYTH